MATHYYGEPIAGGPLEGIPFTEDWGMLGPGEGFPAIPAGPRARASAAVKRPRFTKSEKRQLDRMNAARLKAASAVVGNVLRGGEMHLDFAPAVMDVLRAKNAKLASRKRRLRRANKNRASYKRSYRKYRGRARTYRKAYRSYRRRGRRSYRGRSRRSYR